jgi:Putative transposase
VPPAPWEKDWIVHCTPVGSGQPALQDRAPDIFRVALSTKRILKLEDGHVPFHYTEATTDTRTTQTVLAEEWSRRFLPQGLPNRFLKVRDDGFLSARTRHRLATVNELLHVKPVDTAPPTQAAVDAPNGQALPERRCPKCGSVMRRVGDIAPPRFRLHEACASP